MIALAPYLHTGWKDEPGNNVYAYQHKGYVYLTGEIYSVAPSATTTILTLLPPAYRPAKDTSLTFPIQPNGTTDACNTALEIAEHFNATMKADGTLVLTTPVPASVNAPPPEAEWYSETPEGEGWKKEPQYTQPFRLALVLGNARWLLVEEEDAPGYAAMGGFLLPAFADVDSEYAVHGTRLHLAGHVTATADNVNELTNTLPENTCPATPRGSDATTLHVGGVLRAGEALGHEPGHKEPTAVIVDVDPDIKPVTQTPPLKWFNRMRRGTGPVHQRGTVSKEDIFTGATITCAVDGNAKAEGSPPVIVCHEPTGFEECLLPYGEAFDGTSAGFGISLALAGLLGTCLPQPDWCAIVIWVYGSGIEFGQGLLNHEPEAPSPYCDNFHKCPLGCNDKLGPQTVTAVSLPTAYNEKGELKSPGEEPSITGFLKPPEALYKGPTYLSGGENPNIATSLLWTPAQVAAASIEGSWNSVGYHSVLAHAQATIVPYYQRRQIGVHSGDTIDLTRTGWPLGLGEQGVGPGARATIPNGV
jgi:hypothetical protein